MDFAVARALALVRDPAHRQVTVVREQPMNAQPGSGERRKANLRTALVLLSVAAVFFAGIVAKRALFG